MTAPPDPPGAEAARLLARGAHAEAAAELRRIGELQQAQAVYERIWDFRSAAQVARERGDRPALLRLLLLAGDREEAQLLHGQLRQAEAKDQVAAAQIYEEQGHFGEAAELHEALADLRRARVLYERCRRHLAVGRLSEKLGELREAGVAYEELLAKEDRALPLPERLQAHLGLSRVLRHFGQHEDAVRQLQRARRLGDGDGDRGAPWDEIDRPLRDSLRALGYSAVADLVTARLRARGLGTAENAIVSAARNDGLILGRYRTERLLGAGGMGRVYLAEDLLLKRQVALKIVLPPVHASSDEVAATNYRRFLREAQAAGALSHPHIVPILAVHEAEGLLVMEYLAGGTLADRPLPLPAALARRVLLQILDALGAAHAAGLIHRDIKPQNIFLSATLEAKLGDFGVAHLQDLHATRTGSFIGTLAYMAPEQIAGAPLGFATDVYALGVTAFQLATGRLPFPGPDFVGQHLGEEAPRPSTLRRGLPPAWDRLCERALRKQPAERCATLDDLRRLVLALPREDDATAPVPPPVPPQAPAEEVRKRDPFRLDAILEQSSHSTLWLGVDTRLGRPVIVEEFTPGLLQGEAGATQLGWLRALARLGGPGLQRVLRIDLSPRAARVVYEAPVGAFVGLGAAGLTTEEVAPLRRLLAQLHAGGTVHGAVGRSLLREEALPLLLVSGRGPLSWSRSTPTEGEDLQELLALLRSP